MPATAIGILSNKGGVGKTHLAASLAIALAQRGKKVLLVDADWSSANVTRKLGLTPPRTLRQFFNDECGVADLISATPHHPNLYILAGSPGEFAIANMDHSRKQRLLTAFREIAHHSRGDYILFDLGAGVEARTLDTALAADHQLVVTTPQDVLAGYGCLKALLYRFLDLVQKRPEWFTAEHFRPLLVVNQTLDSGQGKVVANTMRNLLREYASERAQRDPGITQYFQEAGKPTEPRTAGGDGASLPPHGPVLTGGRLTPSTSAFAIPSPSLGPEVDLRLLGEVPYARERF
ncbi:MAG TPA: AAA family ATPase, partial [bacterium]|nr:AAA family ATPase [bacterium]